MSFCSISVAVVCCAPVRRERSATSLSLTTPESASIPSSERRMSSGSSGELSDTTVSMFRSCCRSRFSEVDCAPRPRSSRVNGTLVFSMGMVEPPGNERDPFGVMSSERRPSRVEILMSAREFSPRVTPSSSRKVTSTELPLTANEVTTPLGTPATLTGSSCVNPVALANTALYSLVLTFKIN